MIITYPVHVPYTKGSEQRVVPDSIFNNSEILSGCYPMGKNRFWHGGIHIHPSDRSAPIRAIADGEILAYRYDETDASDAYFDKAPYSRSFVLLKHVTELGQTTLGTDTVTFYSLYMHLQAWGQVKGKTGANAVSFLRKPGDKGILKSTSPTADGACHDCSDFARVRRGDILGYCGSIPDNLTNPSRGIHFEIFFDDVSFLENKIKTIWGRCILSSDLRVVRELQSTEAKAADPKKTLTLATDSAGDGFKKVMMGRESVWVSDDQLTSSEVEVPDTHNKKKTVKQTQYSAIRKELQCYKKDPSKNQRVLAANTPIVPWLDPWMKADEFREESFDGKKWVQVYLPETNELFWAEKSAIRYTSDADWPNFHKVEEQSRYSQDGFIDDEGVQRLSEEYEKERAAKEQAATASAREKFRHLIVRHPTEWSKQDIKKRFGRVTGEAFGAAKLSPEQFTNLTAHIERLSFWEQIRGMPDPGRLWHAHPLKFIEQLAKCMWLSKDELSLIYPEHPLRGEGVYGGTSDMVREKYRNDINKCCYRYGINSRLRLSHFYGQSAVESASLTRVIEGESGDLYEFNSDLGNCQPGDGPRFKGRGLKQITGRYNYSKYWCFRGWLKEGQDFDVGWEHNSAKRYPQVDRPERLLDTTFNCVDASCWYVALFRNRTVTAMDLDDSRKVTRAINGGETDLLKRKKFTEQIKDILL